MYELRSISSFVAIAEILIWYLTDGRNKVQLKTGSSSRYLSLHAL